MIRGYHGCPRQNFIKGYRPLRGLIELIRDVFPGFAGAHPGLYAIGRFADSC